MFKTDQEPIKLHFTQDVLRNTNLPINASIRMSIFAAFLLLSFCVGFPSHVLALDCPKAASLVEKSICGSKSLKEADSKLSDLYFATLKALDGDRHQLLIDSQRSWLAQRENECLDDVETCVTKSIIARQSAIAVCFSDGSGSAAASSNVASCPYYLHRGCPTLEASGSLQLNNYPFLLEKLVTDVKNTGRDIECPSDSSDTEDDSSQSEASRNYSVVTERPGFVCIDNSEEINANGAAHPSSSQSFECYDTHTKTILGFPTVFPTLADGSEDLDKMIALIDGHLDLSCCGDDVTSAGTFSDLSREDKLPSGWAINEQGDLVLGFTYSAYGRSFQAKATVPRADFIEAVEPNYRALFVSAPGK